MTATVMQHRLNVTVTGRGTQVVMLANGLGTTQQTWRHVVPALQDRARVITYDNVCSPVAPAGGYRPEIYASLHAYVDDVLGVLDELDVRDVVFVGHSISGIVGLMAAVAAPERIGHVVTICSTPRFIADVDYDIGMPREAVDALIADARDDYVRCIAAFATRAIGADATVAAREEFLSLITALRPDIGVRALQMIFVGDNRAVLPRVTQPVSVLHTRGDAAVPLAAGEYMVKHLPDATLYPLQATGHLPHFTAPREVAATLLHILDRR